MTFTLSYNQQTINAEVITNSFSKTDIYWNKLKQADNSARFQAVFTIELSNFLKANINNDIQVTIKENGVTEFFGYVRKNLRFSKTQINQPINIEVVSPSFFLDKTIGKNLSYVNKTLGYIVEDLLSRAGFNSTRNVAEMTYTPKLITVSEDDNYKDVITELLYEYGYGCDFDNEGIFFVYSLFNIPSHAEITNEFNGANCLNQIDIVAKDSEYDGVRATFNQITEVDDLIFSDTTNGSSQSKCVQPVLPKKYFADKEFNYLDCDSKYGEIAFIESITPTVKSANSSQMTWTMSKDELDPKSPNYEAPLGKQICFTAYNKSAYQNDLLQIDCSGHVFVANAKTSVTSFGNLKTNEIVLKYICEESKAEDFVKNLTNWYRYANNTISLVSKTNYDLGSFVKITDYGIGTYYGRIIQKQTRLTSSGISYTIETIEEFTPATVEIKNKPSIGGITQSSIDYAMSQSNAYTDSAIEQIELEATPQYSVIYNTPVIRKGTDGGYSPNKITATAYKTTDVQTRYVGDFVVKVNGQEYGTIQDSQVNITVDELLQTFDSINNIEIVFKTSGVDPILVSQYTIAVLSSPSTYSINLENPGTLFEANAEGIVAAHEVTTKAHVYYGLQELEYLGENGWEYGPINAPEGFTVLVDALTGVITIRNEEGNLPDFGRITIPVFIHSQTNSKYIAGYESDARAVMVMHAGYDDYFEGYLLPDESGYFNAYFTFQKFSETAIKLAELSNTVDGYWNTLTNDRVVTVAEKNTLRRILDGFIAEVAVYTAKYSKHKAYGPYFATFTELKKQIENILKTDGNYTFNSVESRNAFNNLFAQYYSNKENLDAEITTLGTNFTEIDTVNKINSLANDAKIGDYFVFTGNETVTAGDVEFLPGMTYVWNGDWWETDNNNEHIMATMSEAMSVINGQTADSIPAVTFAKRLIAMQVVTNELIAKYATVENLNVTNGKLTVTNETLSETNRTLSGVNQSLTETKTDLSQNYYTKTQLGTKSNETVIDGGNLKNDSVETRSLIVDDAFMERLATKILSLREGGIIKSDNWDGELLQGYTRTDGTLAIAGDYYLQNGEYYVITNNKYPYESFNTHRTVAPQVYQFDVAGKYISVEYTPFSNGTLSVKETVTPPGGAPRPPTYHTLYPGDSFIDWGMNLKSLIIWTGKDFVKTYTDDLRIQLVSEVTIPKITKNGTKGFIQLASGKAEFNDDVIATNIHITGDSTFEGSGKFTGEVNASSGTFNGTVNASSGVFNNVSIADTCEVFGSLGTVTNISGLDYDYGVQYDASIPPMGVFSEIVLFYSMEIGFSEYGSTEHQELIGMYLISWYLDILNMRNRFQRCKLVRIIDKGTFGSAWVENGSIGQYVRFSNPSLNANNCRLSHLRLN